MNREQASVAIDAIGAAALMLADCTSTEMQLADQRALVKDAGIKRLMAAGVFTSVTASEKGIELDAEFMQHRQAERDAVAARILAQAKYESARLRARLAVSLVPLDEPVFEQPR